MSLASRIGHGPARHSSPPEPTLPSRNKRDWITIAIFGAIVLAVVIYGLTADWVSLDRLAKLVTKVRDAKGTLVIFTLLSIGVAAVGLPITPMQLMGGVLFGIWRGGALNWGTAVVGGCIGFYLAQKFGKNTLKRLVERMAHRSVKFSGPKARRTLLRLRLIPLTPFGALNFAAGLAGMRFLDFLIATAIGIIPSLAVFTYFAAQVIGGGAKARHEAIVNTIIAAGVLLALSYIPTVWDRLTGEKNEV